MKKFMKVLIIILAVASVGALAYTLIQKKKA